MSEIVRARLEEVCPVQKIKDMSYGEIVKSTNVAFKIIGYEPINLEEAMSYINNTSDVEMLSDYIYEVWEADQ